MLSQSFRGPQAHPLDSPWLEPRRGLRTERGVVVRGHVDGCRSWRGPGGPRRPSPNEDTQVRKPDFPQPSQDGIIVLHRLEKEHKEGLLLGC